MFRKSRKQLTIRFLHRTVLFLTCFSVCLAFLYGFGNGQSFLDETQMVILQVLSFLSLFASMIAGVLFLMELFFLVMQKRRLYLGLMGVSLVCALACGVLSAFARAIILFSRGA